MLYFEHDKDYYLVWPVLALSIRGEFWIEVGWLNAVFGWRSGDDGFGDEAKLREKNSL